MKSIKSTERELFPAWWHILALSHPQDDVQAYTDRVAWADGFGGLCGVLDTRFYKLVHSLQNSFLESRLDTNCALSQAAQGFMWTACARSKVAGWFICPVGRLLGEDVCLLDPWLSYTQ